MTDLTVSDSTFREVRCECNRMLLRISSTSQARIEAKCIRCHKVTVFLARRVEHGDG